MTRAEPNAHVRRYLLNDLTVTLDELLEANPDWTPEERALVAHLPPGASAELAGGAFADALLTRVA